MKTVMCFGTFDLLHIGHLYYFRQAKEYGDHLIVVVARDATKEKQKKEIIFTEKERLTLLSSLRFVDEVVLGYPDDHLKIIIEKKPDVLCLGYDHPVSEERLQIELAKRNSCPLIVRAKPYQPDHHKSSVMRSSFLSAEININFPHGEEK